MKVKTSKRQAFFSSSPFTSSLVLYNGNTHTHTITPLYPTTPTAALVAFFAEAAALLAAAAASCASFFKTDSAPCPKSAVASAAATCSPEKTSPAVCCSLLLKAVPTGIEFTLMPHRAAQAKSKTQFEGAGAGSGVTNATALYAGSSENAACGRFVVPPEFTAFHTNTASRGEQFSLSWRCSQLFVCVCVCVGLFEKKQVKK